MSIATLYLLPQSVRDEYSDRKEQGCDQNYRNYIPSNLKIYLWRRGIDINQHHVKRISLVLMFYLSPNLLFLLFLVDFFPFWNAHFHLLTYLFEQCQIRDHTSIAHLTMHRRVT